MTMCQPLSLFFHLTPPQTLKYYYHTHLRMGKPRHGAVKRLAPRHTANTMQNLDLNQGCSLKPKGFTILPHHFIYQMEKHIDDVEHFEICYPMQI